MKRITKKRGTVWLRNRLIEAINNWHMLDATVTSGFRFFGKDRPKYKGLSRLVIGVGKGGKAIAIYPYRQGSKNTPLAVCRLMRDWADRGALVGMAVDILDGWDICADDEKDYKRKRRTYYYRERLAEHAAKLRRDDESEE